MEDFGIKRDEETVVNDKELELFINEYKKQIIYYLHRKGLLTDIQKDDCIDVLSKNATGEPKPNE